MTRVWRRPRSIVDNEDRPRDLHQESKDRMASTRARDSHIVLNKTCEQHLRGIFKSSIITRSYPPADPKMFFTSNIAHEHTLVSSL